MTGGRLPRISEVGSLLSVFVNFVFISFFYFKTLLDMGCMVWDSNPGGARFSMPIQNDPEPHPASYTMSIWSLSQY
jgi:hypothetical protein